MTTISRSHKTEGLNLLKKLILCDGCNDEYLIEVLEYLKGSIPSLREVLKQEKKEKEIENIIEEPETVKNN